MSKSGTPPLSEMQREAKRRDRGRSVIKTSRSKKRSRSSSDSASSSSLSSSKKARKSRSKIKIIEKNRTRKMRRSSSSDSSTSQCSIKKNKHKKRRQVSRSRSSSVLTKLVMSALETKNNNSGHGGQNVIPEFNPQSKNQSMKDWIQKINESAYIYGWSEKQTIYYALPRLTGLAKRWYDGLTSVKFSWDEWQEKLLKAFPCEDNYGDLLAEMLARRSRRDETLEEYYYDKIGLINRCEITGQKAVDCITHGIFDHNIRMNAQGASFKEPQDVLTYFRKISTRREELPKFKNYDQRLRERSSFRDRPNFGTQKRPIDSGDRMKRSDIKCFNCGEVGHIWTACTKEVQKCNKCKRVGHNDTQCKDDFRKINTGPNTRNVLNIESASLSSDKYFKDVTVNGHIVKGFVDLGSECTLLSNTVPLDTVKLLSNESLPLLKGFANGTILPLGTTEICVQIDELVENVKAYVVPHELLPKDTSILIGQNLTELPDVRVYKDDTKLILFKTMDQAIKIKLRNTVEVNSTTMVPVEAEDCPMRTNLYISSDACLKPNSEFIILPGVYTFQDGCAQLVVISLTPSTIKLHQGQLLTRGIKLPEFILEKQDKVLKIQREQEKEVLNVCRLVQQTGKEVIHQDIINTDQGLDENVKTRLCGLLNNNRDCFAFSTSELGKTALTEMRIKLKDDTPVMYRPYRLSFPERQKVKEMIEDLCDNGIIRESCSEYASPIIVVPKKTGDLRLCVDYRALNKKTCKDKYPMPLIEDQVDSLGGQKYFTTLDLTSGYHQIPISEDCKHLTAFITQDGHYEYNRMPFGLCNAPAVFQRLIHKVLNAKKIPGVLAYMDDIVISSTDIEEGMNKLSLVLEALKEANLTLNLTKCHFFRTRIEYLGLEISADGVQPGIRKTEAVASFKRPENVHEIRQFIGLASFFRRFVPGFATIARPLTSLTKSNVPWVWGKEQEEAFLKLKDILVSRPVLAIYNPQYMTEVHTDASQLGIGGILMQRPDEKTPLSAVAYFSRQTTAEEQHFHSFELETLAVIMSLNRFRNYLLGLTFKVVTDCNAVRLTWTKRDLVPRIARWWLQAQEFDFVIEYRPGIHMSHVDALSRNSVAASSEPIQNRADILKITEVSELEAIQYTDPNLVHIKCILDNKCDEAKEIKNNYQLKDGKIYRKIGDSLRWAVPQDARWKVCHMSHDECGHLALDKTLHKIKQTYWFPHMTSFVKKYVRACIPCAYAKQPAGKKEGYLHPIPKTPIPFHSIHIDHLGPFIRSKTGNTYILGIIDGYTKFIILKAVRNTKSKTTIAVLRDVFALFGAPKLLISDRGTSFTSGEFADFAQELEIKHIKNAVAMPRANGQIERYNRTVLASLAAMTHGESDKEWDTYLSTVQWSLNNTLNKGIGKTPAEVVFGKRTVNISEAHLHDIVEDETVNVEETLEKIRKEVSRTIDKNQKGMKERFDKKRCPAKEYKEGDLVLVQKQMNNPGESNKLLPSYSGPYRVTKVLGFDRYEVSSIEGHTGRKYCNVYSADKMKYWIRISSPEREEGDSIALSDDSEGL